MPSMSEGLPTAMLEAMACGCVPVVSDVGNVTDAAHHGVNALVISEWSDIQSFTSAVQKLLNDEPFRNRLAMNGRQLVVDKYRPEKQAEVVDDILTYLNSKRSEERRVGKEGGTGRGRCQQGRAAGRCALRMTG